MNKTKELWGQLQFSAQEKQDLTARLARAAEQEENMTDSTKRKVKKVSRGMVIGIAAALTLTVGTLAATLSPGLRSYFDTGAAGAQSRLESGITQLGRSLEHNGWTVALTDCAGDDNIAYIWVEVTAPEGTVLAEDQDHWFRTYYQLGQGELGGATGGSLYTMPDEDPEDNRIAFCIEVTALTDTGLCGSVMDIALDPIQEIRMADTERYQEIQVYDHTEAIRDHSWVFEDVALNYPDQTIRLEPNVEVPYLDGTATLTRLDLSPMTVTARVEGGSCYDYNSRGAAEEKSGDTEAEVIEVPAGTITIGGSGLSDWELGGCYKALGVEIHMKDGTVLSQLPIAAGSGGDNGLSGNQPYVEGRFHYKAQNYNKLPDRIIDPAQVDYVTVCGVDIPVAQE